MSRYHYAASNTVIMPSQPVVDDGVVIIGAGIMGCATAYYLTEIAKTEASKIHLVEVSPELFASASGKAAGFLASDCTSSSIQ